MKASLSSPIDPVCGMPVEFPTASLDHGREHLTFCSEFCKQQFQRHPGAYDATRAPSARADGWAARDVAYFSMEIALQPGIPTYSGGLGVLAGDTLRSCADLEVPVVAVSLVYRKGYFNQKLQGGEQLEGNDAWRPADHAHLLAPSVNVELEGRHVKVRAWRYDSVGSSNYVVPVVLLDTDLPENDAEQRSLTDFLYGGDARYRLMQEAVLGVGGARMLRALGCNGLRTFHLNEGHAAFAPLELLREQAESTGSWDAAGVRHKMVFTTHTPVAAGHDQFDWRLARQVLGSSVPPSVFEQLAGSDSLNMTRLALNLSHYVNGVALRHREVSSRMFPNYEIHQITNGVHSLNWTSAPFRALFDRYIPGWRSDPLMLRNGIALPPTETWNAHQAAKQALLDVVEAQSGRRLSSEVLTLGFARRMTAYKRPELILSDIERLRRIAKKQPMQILFAGKAHPRDDEGKARIRALIAASDKLGGDVPVVYLADYGIDLAHQLIAGADLWLNTPLRPLEASGTSGMKAAHNGVPSFSVLDGWWAEGHIEDVTGWAIGGTEPETTAAATGDDVDDLYRKLEHVILPRFYGDRPAWTSMMRHCIALNASFFSARDWLDKFVTFATHAPNARGSVDNIASRVPARDSRAEPAKLTNRSVSMLV